jgi:hypothetical protein
MAGTGGANCPTVPGAKMFTFEADGELWEIPGNDSDRIKGTPPVISTVQKHGGEKSMEITVDTALGKPMATDAGAGMQKTAWFAMVKNGMSLTPYLQAGRTFKVWVWVPTGHKITAMQLVVHVNGNQWTNAPVFVAENQWIEATLTLPNTFDCSKISFGHFEIGLFWTTPANENWSGKIYVDDFSISAKP